MNYRLFTIFLILCFALPAFSKSGREIIRENNFKTEVHPLLTTEWSQDGGENSMTPEIDGKHTKTGCGATAIAQVMKFWNYPTNGFGKNYYIWDKSKSERVVRYADFENSYYDWANMINRYKNNDKASTEEIAAVSKLMSDIGVALEMKYTEDGTATDIEFISTALKKYFGYNSNMTLHRFKNGAYTYDEWLVLLYRELSEGRPVIMGGGYQIANNIYNHIYVADGYDADGKVHLNLGKASIGSVCNIDGYYDLTVTGQTYNIDMRMLIGICPYNLPTDITVIDVPTAGLLKEAMGGEIAGRKICRIKINGSLNSSDILWLAQLSASTSGQLSYIDLSDAHIVNNSLQESVFDGCNTLQEIKLPVDLTRIETKAFRNCIGLWHVTLPDNLSYIGNYAFTNCRYLESIELPQSLSSIGINPFRYDKLTSFSVQEGNYSFMIDNGALLDKSRTSLKSMPLLTIGEYRIPESVKCVENQAFVKQCMIQDLYIPAAVTQIKSNSFLESIGIKNVYNYSEIPPSFTSDSFPASIYGNCTVHVPKEHKNAYETSDWPMLGEIVDDIYTMGFLDILQDNSARTHEIYNLHGNKVTELYPGAVYVIRYSDGTFEKIMIK